MGHKIDQDNKRFRKIVKGKIRENLRKYIKRGELIGRKGKDTVSIPLPQIETPRFRYGSKDTGGIGQGPGNPGDPLGPGESRPGDGEAGDQPGDHVLEVEVTIEELAKIMGEELELPCIKPKGKKNITTKKDRYTSVRCTGPESLRNFRRTYKEALKRKIASGTYDPKNPIVVPIKEDKRYRSWKEESIPETNAVIIYMMDVSGSMGQEQKDIVRIESFWIDTWLRSQYSGIESRYIIHDATAKEVDEKTFYHTRESGGTIISSAYDLCVKMIERHFNPSEWNIYPFHFSDGDNWSEEDTVECIRILRKGILPACNIFCYGQVESPYGSGQFLKDLKKSFDEKEDRLITSEIGSKDDIIDSIKTFLGKGR